jgi:tRNA(His) guanylyltransferase
MKKEKATDANTLGGRLKGYESDYESVVESDKHIMVRIDGHHFSKYTKGVVKPFDRILSEAMVLVTKDLVERFDAYTGYTQSDEISLFIPSLKDVTVDNRKSTKHKLNKRVRDDWSHGFGGRVQKMCSLISAYTTMSFNKHFTALIPKIGFDFPEDYGMEDATHNEWIEYINTLSKKAGNAYFDARMYGVPDEDEVFNSFMWRVRDAEKNSRSMFAQAYCSHKQLQNMNGVQQVEFCLEKSGKDWNLVHDSYKYGTLVKKELYDKTVAHPLPSFPEATTTVQRSRIVEFSEALTSYNEKDVKMIMSKYKVNDQ